MVLLPSRGEKQSDMIKVMLDTNIFDKLEVDEKVRFLLKSLISRSLLTVVMPRSVVEELSRSPMSQVCHSFFPITYTGNTVDNIEMAVCDSMGSGETFLNHLGISKNFNDAYIVDASEYYADWLVSEDQRFKKRAEKFTHSIKVMDYAEFVKEINFLALKKLD
jgi:predicted nucleic acid-binding protein